VPFFTISTFYTHRYKFLYFQNREFTQMGENENLSEDSRNARFSCCMMILTVGKSIDGAEDGPANRPGGDEFLGVIFHNFHFFIPIATGSSLFKTANLRKGAKITFVQGLGFSLPTRSVWKLRSHAEHGNE
jgi:hypothetical protein